MVRTTTGLTAWSPSAFFSSPAGHDADARNSANTAPIEPRMIPAFDFGV